MMKVEESVNVRFDETNNLKEGDSAEEDELDIVVKF